MRLPKSGPLAKNPEFLAAKKAAKKIYPYGKALARLQHVEAQRGLPETGMRAGALRTMDPRPKAKRGKKLSAAAKKLPKIPFVASMRKKAKLTPDFADAAQLPVWKELGPWLIPHGQTYGTGGNNKPSVAGRAVGLYVDPSDSDHLVLCSAGGGLWASRNRGVCWNALTDDQPTLSMGAIAHAPGAPNVVYAGTGEGDTRSRLGFGILRSADAGRTWELCRVPELEGTGIYDIAVHPQDPMHLWIGAVNGFFVSRDGGESVRRIRRGLTWSISVNPAGDEVFVASSGGLHQSTDGGSTWSSVSLSLSGALMRLEVCHAPSKPAVVYVAAATEVGNTAEAALWRRATSSGNFTAQKVPSGMNAAQGWYDWCLAVSPDKHDEVYWGGIHLWRGRRGSAGFRWSNIASRSSGDSIHPDQHHVAFDPNDPRVVYALNDGGIYRSPDRGGTWESLNPGLGITEFEYAAQLESDATWILGGLQDNGTIVHRGARKWDQVALGDGGDCAAIDQASPFCYHSYYGMWIERAAAKGSNAFNWTNVSPPFFQGYPALFYPPLEAADTLLTKAGATVFVSEDRGATWHEVVLPAGTGGSPGLASALAIVSPTRIVVGTHNGSMFRITRPSAGWGSANVTRLTSPRTGAYVSDIVALGATGTTLWTTSPRLGGGHVFRSTDGGTTWANRSGDLPNIPVNAIIVDPRDRDVVYVGTDHGVYRSQDAGESWRVFGSGLPSVVVGDLLFLQSENRLRAATRNRGAWEIEA